VGKHILIVDDDALLRRSLAFNLEQAGYQSSTASSAEDALAMTEREQPDLILLDIGLPGMDGLDALRAFQSKMNVPIIFVSARRRELDQVLGLELGADDYITKPFDLDILLARIKAVLRRSGHPTSVEGSKQPLQVGDLLIDPGAHTVFIGKRLLNLSPKEFDLLFTLAIEAGKVISTEDLTNRVWGAEFAGQPQVLYVHMRWLREKLETIPDQPQRLLTVRGIGYKLVPKES
jgi:DNA-binding response OmpR family regulator